MNVLFIVPPSNISLFGEKAMLSSLFPPLSLYYMIAYLKKYGFSADVIDIETDKIDRDKLVKLISNKNINIIGFTTMVTTFKNSLRVAKFIKERFPHIKIVLGGAQATFCIEESLKDGYVDAVCRFEGEKTMKELVEAFNNNKPLNKIKGIAYKNGKDVILTADREPIEDIDTLPFPLRRDDDKIRYKNCGVIITGRGCTSKCIFCAAAAFCKSKYRPRKPINVIEEIKELSKKYRMSRHIFIADDTFTLLKNRAYQICELILEKNLNVEWACEARVNTIDKELLMLMRQSGCVGIQFGIESGNQDTLNRIKKGTKLDQLKQAVAWSVEAGINVVGSFILGLPFENPDMVKTSFSFARELESMAKNKMPTVKCQFAFLTPLPGTELYNNYNQYGLKFMTRNWDRFTFLEPVVETSELTKVDLRRLLMDWLQRKM